MKIFLILFLSIFIVSCAGTRGLEKRISKNPTAYGKLSERHKSLIDKGEISEGMSKDAVFFAWGMPSSIRMGSSKGRKLETWSYYRNSGLDNLSLSMAYGHVWGGRFGHRRGRFLHHGIGINYPFWTYSPHNFLYNDVWHNNLIQSRAQRYRKAVFVNGKVSSWESDLF